MYYTNIENNSDFYDCLYIYSKQEIRSARYNWPKENRALQLVPYCIRTPYLKNRTNDLNCHGKLYSFDELKARNITSEQLFDWHAPTDTIDDYGKYLTNSQETNGSFCNCTNQHYFGTSCQYTFKTNETSFEQITKTRFKMKYRRSEIELGLDDITCYINHKCKGNITCLDWRQICNGMVDCDDESDEYRCTELEGNECDDETEFRCNNGMCIPKSFSFDLVFDCSDASDEQFGTGTFYTYPCTQSHLIECEEYNCGWLTYSCSDGDCIFNDVWSCTNGRYEVYVRKMFEYVSDGSLSIVCWKTMLCLMGFTDLYEIDWDVCEQWCEDSCESQLPIVCNDTFFFPQGPFLFPFVRALYMNNKTNWEEDKLPDFICFDSRVCPYYLGLPMADGFLCRSAEELKSRVADADWNEFLSEVLLFFSSCSASRQLLNDTVCAQNLFKCNITNRCLSKHRVGDGYIDCFSRIDEKYSDTCELNFTNRFKCFNGKQCIPRKYLSDRHSDCDDGSDEYLSSTCNVVDSTTCQYLQGASLISAIVNFQDICNGDKLYLFSKDNDTDESECDEWPLVFEDITCDGVWNTVNGRDELDCGNRTIESNIAYSVGKCKTTEHYCIKSTIETIECLPLEKAGDGVIDCLGASDERHMYCGSEWGRYKCLNSSKCIHPHQLCDRRHDCPLNDDEDTCNYNGCLVGEFFPCKSTCLSRNSRCDGVIDCLPEGEDEWLCDLMDRRKYKPLTTIDTEYLSARSLKTGTHSENGFFTVSNERHTRNDDHTVFYCYRGVLISSEDAPFEHCLCSPAYYGSRCQYQRERISVVIQKRYDDWTRTDCSCSISPFNAETYLLLDTIKNKHRRLLRASPCLFDHVQ
ncbi:unnamed protein product [Didymodactylos carnosus]|uniref:EGF-like domain-containing protein n=1 Tax=Didymodactylos carnosus TaxID=1234261 RepID=A0A814BT30_9BILA|nr:unnamed protein product [Didymodactylos carnosus]CAF1091549.1 unnamed protein product [Didymodactylos carnosus]CAF3710143.1 unnamed protein product [Didymodactylos carnosus]CAF3853106.1 unnamed protein product [Didymodactylos carnosus]